VSAVAEPIATTTSVVPLIDAIELNPRPDRSALSDHLEVSFVPMAAVEAVTGRMDATAVRQFGEVKKGYTVFSEGDVLFAKITPCMENGKMAVARGLRNGVGCGSTEFHVLRPRAGVDPQYVYHFVSSARFRAEAAHHMTGAVGQKRVPAAFLEQCQIPLPDRDEQRRIVAEIEKQFSRLDEAVANLKRVKANLKHYKAAVLKAAVDGRLVATEADLAARDGRRFETGAQFLERVLRARSKNWAVKGRYRVPLEPSDESLPVVPPGWGRATWDQLSHWVTYGFTRPMPHVPTGVPIVTARHIGNGRIDFRDVDFTPEASFEKLSEKDRPRVGDILITKDGAIGRAAVVETDKPFCINQSVAVVWLRSLTADPRYLLLVIEGPGVQKRIREKARGVAIQHLSITDLAAMTLPLPPLAEQNRIVAEVDRRLSIVREIEAEVDANLKRAQVLRQAVLARAFSGADEAVPSPA
jgi:type I restriction enzyme, S subunit